MEVGMGWLTVVVDEGGVLGVVVVRSCDLEESCEGVEFILGYCQRECRVRDSGLLTLHSKTVWLSTGLEDSRLARLFIGIPSD